jgi:hypothetical protein
MKTKAIMLTLALGSLAIGGQTIVKLERKYKAGEKDSYAMTMQVVSASMNVDISTTITQTVKKVYDNGEADMMFQPGPMTIKAMGQTINRDGGPSVTNRLDRFGMPLDNTKGSGMSTFLTYSSTLGDREFKVGETYPIKVVDAKKPNEKVEGTAKVESLEAGVVKIVTKVDVTQQGLQKPMHVESTALVEVATGKPNHIEGIVTGLQMGGAESPPIETAKFTFDRKK